MNCRGQRNGTFADALAGLSVLGIVSTCLSPWEATVLPLNYARVYPMLVGAVAPVQPLTTCSDHRA